MAAELLYQLRDIHYPEAITIWPLAIGWYCLFGVVVVTIFVAIYLWLQNIKKNRLKKIVLKRLEELQEQQASEKDISEELSMLLKRAALANYPRRQVAGLHGEEWLRFLDKTSMTTEFTAGYGRLLIICPYRGKQQQLPHELFHLIQNWVRKNL